MPWARVGLVLIWACSGCCSWAMEETAESLRAYPRPWEPVDVIVVPGCPTLPDGGLSTCNRRRVEAAVQVYRRGEAPRILFSGAAVRTPFGEATAMAAYARSLGVPKRAVFVETRARHTQQNIRYAARILRARGWSRVVIVTDPAQLPIALFLARLSGLRAYGQPTVPPLAGPELRARVERDAVEPFGYVAWH